MNKCPFWSTLKEEVECFGSCAFYNKDEECPFKLYLERDILKEYFQLDTEDIDEGYDTMAW